VDGGAGDKVALGQLAETLAALPISQDGLAIETQRFASDVPTYKKLRSTLPSPPLHAAKPTWANTILARFSVMSSILTAVRIELHPVDAKVMRVHGEFPALIALIAV
jgi:hypothetical protein